MSMTLETWLTLPRQELAAVVQKHHLAVKVAVDGSTRHYLLRHPSAEGKIQDVENYFQDGLVSWMRLVDLLFSCGIHTLVMLAMWPPDLERREDHLRRIVGASHRLLLSELALSTFRRWGVRARLFGNYDISPVLAGVREELFGLARELEAATPSGDGLALWGFSAGTGLDEVIARSVELSKRLGRVPTTDEVRVACFPNGPEHVDIFIGGGWLRVGNIDLPVVLNAGTTDIYSLSHLPLDLTEHEVRLILYDHLFLRHMSSPTDDLKYTPEVLEPLRTYYADHAECVLGLGQVVGQGFWYPEHRHDGK